MTLLTGKQIEMTKLSQFVQNTARVYFPAEEFIRMSQFELRYSWISRHSWRADPGDYEAL
jgi:hypothetical protein